MRCTMTSRHRPQAAPKTRPAMPLLVSPLPGSPPPLRLCRYHTADASVAQDPPRRRRRHSGSATATSPAPQLAIAFPCPAEKRLIIG